MIITEFPVLTARYCRAAKGVPLKGEPSKIENSESSQLQIIFTPLITMVEQLLGEICGQAASQAKKLVSESLNTIMPFMPCPGTNRLPLLISKSWLAGKLRFKVKLTGTSGKTVFPSSELEQDQRNKIRAAVSNFFIILLRLQFSNNNENLKYFVPLYAESHLKTIRAEIFAFNKNFDQLLIGSYKQKFLIRFLNKFLGD